MKKILLIFTAMLMAFAVNAAPVVLPATLDVTNVSFRSDGMPDFVLADGDYAGTYFDMGAHDNANDTLLYAEWDVTIQPIKYNVAVDVYNTNSWRVQLYVLNQAGDTVKSLRYKGSSGQCGQFPIGAIDMSDLQAGNYKVRAHAATAWSAMKLKDVIFDADYQGVTVDLPGTLQPAYALLSANASISNKTIAFKPSTANEEWATWNVNFAKAGSYNVAIDITASNGHNYGVALLSADGQSEIGAVNEGGQKSDTGAKELGAITVPAAGKYVVKLTNAIQWSEALLNSITFAAPAEPLMKTIYCKAPQAWWQDGGAAVGVYTWDDKGNQKAAWPGERMTLVKGETDVWTCELDINKYKMCIFTRMNPVDGDNQDWGAKTADLTIPTDENDLYTITSETAVWGDPGVTGAWSKYEATQPIDPTKPYTLFFNYYNNTGSDKSNAETKLDGLFAEASLAYIDTAAASTLTNVYLGRKYKDDISKDSVFSNVKFGTSKAAGTLKFALKNMNVDSVIFRAAKYSDSEGGDGFTVNGTALTLSRGNKKFEDVKYVPAEAITALDIAQAKASGGRFYMTSITVYPKVEAPEANAPAEAPAAPTYEKYQVKAVYSAKYEADCNFGEWGSGTVYTQEDYGKKYVTNNMGYFGLEFVSHLDCSEMEALHLDVWSAVEDSFRVVPIHGGTEVGVKVKFEAKKWNAIDIPLAQFEGVTNWSDVYQIKIDNASNKTFWLNNVYFYTTQTKTVDLADGYYLIGSMNDWDIHNLKATDKFEANINTQGEYTLTAALADGDEFKVVAIATNAITTWYPAEGANYKVDFAHAGEAKTIFFRPDGQGGEGWHAGCIYVEKDQNANPWETWFASGDTWNTETESHLDWDAENEKATVYINVDKYGQWRAQVKYHGPVAEADKCYRVALKMKANHAINNVTIKYQDNVEMVYVADAALQENVEFVFDTVVAGAANGNGIMVLDFGFAKKGDTIQIYNVAIEEAECPVVEHTYTVAGNSAEAFNNTWDPTNIANNMDLQEDGTYKWEKTDLTLAAGNIEFKICEDHAWTHAWPEENYKLAIPEAGVYTITITFNPAAEADQVAAVATKTGDAQVDPTVSIAGGMNGWSATADMMTLAEDKASASLKMNLTAQTYEFKVVLNGGDWRSNAQEFTRENATAADMTGNLDNMKLVADVAGEYIFTWTFATNTLVVTYPAEDQGVEDVNAGVKAVKTLENGMLIIEKNGVKYNVMGQIIR